MSTPSVRSAAGWATQTLRPYSSAERKELPVHEVMAHYFPDALAAVARHSKKANDKHNPGEPMHWARDKSTDHLNCAARHLMTPDAIDPDTGEIELVGATWRCMAALQLREEKRLAAAGITPLSGVVPQPDVPRWACGCPRDLTRPCKCVTAGPAYRPHYSDDSDLSVDARYDG